MRARISQTLSEWKIRKRFVADSLSRSRHFTNTHQETDMTRHFPALPLYAALLSAGLLAGCTAPGRINVVSIQPLASGLDAKNRIMPGAQAAFEVRIKDKDGKVFSTSDNSLSWDDLTITAANASFDRASGKLTFRQDVGQTPDSRYQINVTYKHAPEIKGVLSVQPDWALILGPAPDQVASLSVTLEGYKDGDRMSPGISVPLKVEVKDLEGRYFGLGDTRNPLPIERLDIETQNMDFSRQNLSLSSGNDKKATEGVGYGVSVKYRGNPVQTYTARFQPDFQLVEGPDAKDVQDIFFGEQTLKVTSAIPGFSVPLQFQVKDKEGRIYTYPRPGNQPTMPANKIRIIGENLVFNETSNQLQLKNSYQGMVGKAYKVFATYEGRDDIVTSHTIQPDFLHGLPLMENHAIELIGGKGGDGRGGQNGSNGPNGSASPVGLGGSGASGTDGTHGGPGRNGQHGPAIQVLSQEVRTLDGQHRLALVEVTGPGQSPKYYLRQLNERPLQVTSIGGAGGDGGNAGNGGNGGNGGDGKYGGGSGGRGGNGGNGGNGANGGNGGKVLVLVSTPDMETAFIPLSQGGEGGKGGEGGVGGKGGSAGSILYAKDAASGNNTSSGSSPAQPIPLAATGSEGSSGANGAYGVPGNRGDDGAVEIRVDQKAGDVIRRAPKSLVENVLY
jgi:hypothetical protein